MADCPPRESLERLLAEALGERERAQIEAHVEGCRDCQKTLHDLTMGPSGSNTSELLPALAHPPRKSRSDESEAFFDRLKQIKLPVPDEDAAARAASEQVRWVEIEGYEILGLLGRGAAGVVYRARHLKLNRLVALKVIIAGPHLSTEVRQRFQAEAHAIARLHHPNIVQIYDFGEHEERPFLSLELVEGGNLADWMTGKPRPADEAARIIATLAKAVEYAHRQGVVHRDLKPANVLLSTVPDKPLKRELKITDFGIAKVFPKGGMTESRMTQTGQILGTPAYMAPEQARGHAKDISPATDVYSLGAMLYELLTGRPPFQGATPLDTLMQAARQDPVSITLLVPRVPRDLNTICLKCLEKSAELRYATAGELAADLGRFLCNGPIQARPTSLLGQALRWTRRHQGLAASLVSAAVLLVLLTAGSLVASAYFRAMEQQQRQLAQEKETARGEAVTAELHELELRQQAQREDHELRQNLYYNQMTLAAQAALSPSGIGRVCDWLAPWAQTRPDLRNWEWFYLNGLCHRERATLLGNSGAVLDVTWSPDGRRLASAGTNGMLQIWSVAEQRVIPLLAQGNLAVRRVVWSLDGSRLATADWDGTVTVWNPDTGEKVVTFAGNGTALFSVGWSPDGSHLASGGIDRAVTIWDAKTGSVEKVLRGHAGDVRDVEWSPDGKRIASAGADADIRIWDAVAGRELLTLHGHTNFVNRVAWNSDGSKLASASNDETVKIWNPADGTELMTLRGHSTTVCALAWSPDNTRLASGGEDQAVRVSRTADGVELFSLRGHTQPITAIVWSPDGTRIASGSYDRTIKIWDAATGPEVPSLSSGTLPILTYAWSPDGRQMAAALSDQSLCIWEVATGKQRVVLRGHTDQIFAVAWSPNGTRLASAANDHTIRVWDAADGKQINSFDLGAETSRCVAWSSDSRQLASAGIDNLVRIWDPLTGKQIRLCAGHASSVRWVAWSPDGKRLASASDDRTVKIWDPATGRETLTLVGHSEEVHTVAWSPDGRFLASGGNDQTVKLWNSTTGETISTLRGHSARICSVAWHPDGTRLASTSIDRTTKLWDTNVGRETMSLECLGTQYSASWSADGMILATGGSDDKILLCDAAPGYIAARATQYLPLLNQKIAANPADGANLQLRAEIQAREGQWDKAASDAQQLAALNKEHRWSTFGYWVVGPYPDNLHAHYPPEENPNPVNPVARMEGSGGPASLSWDIAPLTASGFLDFGSRFQNAEHISGYALMRVYAVDQQQVAILLGADDQSRLWLNGKQIHENLVGGAALPDAEAIPATLTAGWNTLLVRVVNTTGPHAMYLRLSNAQADLKRANGAAAKR